MRCTKLLAALACSAAACLTASNASAGGIPKILRENTRPWFFTGGIGPSFGLNHRSCGRFNCGSGFGTGASQFKVSAEIGYHFKRRFEGPALGASVDFGLGSNYLRFEPGAKFWWDIKVKDGLGMYVAPFVKAGLAALAIDTGFVTTEQFYFNTQFGASGRLSLGNRGVVFLTPLNIDMLANGDRIVFAYEVLAGGGVTW